MAAQLTQLCFPQRSLGRMPQREILVSSCTRTYLFFPRGFYVPLRRAARSYKGPNRTVSRRFTVKWLPRLRYASEREDPCCDVENLEGSNMLDGSTNLLDITDDLEIQLNNFFLEVKTNIERGNTDDAVYLLQANYEAVKEHINSGHKGIEQAAVLDTLALGYMALGDFKTVEHLLHLLKEIAGILHDNTPLFDSILMHMGSISITLGNFEEAILFYERGLKIIEQQCGVHSPFLITPVMGLAKALRFSGRVTEAVTLYYRALDILANKRGINNEDLVIPLYALGNLFISEGKATDAVNCFNRILDIYRKVYGGDNGRVGIAMCSLAHALCAKGNVSEAISMYKSGLQIIKDTKYMALDDDLLEKMRNDLAELLHVVGREQEGRELLEECLIISEKYRGIENPSSLTHLLNLAMSHSHSKNFVEAERLLRTCLRIMLRTVGPTDQSITVPMLHLAVTLYNLKRDKEAEHLALEVVRIREDAFGKESFPVGEALDCLASIQIRLGKDDNTVLAILRRVLQILEKELGYDSEETMTTLKKVVFYLDKMGKKDEKLPLQRRLSLLRSKYKQKVSV